MMKALKNGTKKVEATLDNKRKFNFFHLKGGNNLDKLEKLLQYEVNLHTGIEIIQTHSPNNEAIDVLEELLEEIGKRIEEIG